MRSWLRALSAVLLVALAAPVGSAASEDASVDGERPGYLIVQLDGLAEPVLRQALDAGAMPFVRGLLDAGSHELGSWRTTSASTTTIAQAGLLHSEWRQIPAFRWWDRESGELVDFLDRAKARQVQERVSGPRDLLVADGASVTNLFDGSAPRSVLTATHLDGLGLVWEVLGYAADPRNDGSVLAGFATGAVADLVRSLQGQTPPIAQREARRKAPVPIVGPALEWALVDVTTAAVRRELERETPIIYATYTTYDEVGHYAGPEHPAAIAALTYLDEALRQVAAAADGAVRPYELIVLSDHGQTDGRSFAARYGQTLEEVIREHMSAAGHSDPESESPDLVVAASGNLAHVYFPRQGRRLEAPEIETLHPGLIERLAGHPGVGVVTVSDDGEAWAVGPEGRHALVSGTVEGTDPLEPYGPLAAPSLRTIAASPDAGDLVVVSMYDPAAGEVASFEAQIGSHGGIGGAQMEPFVLYPRALERSDEPLALEGVDELRARLDQWLGDPGAAPVLIASDPSSAGSPPEPPVGAHIGEPVCLAAEVDGAEASVCARRQRFGADWIAQLTDTADDGRRVEATITLGVEDAPDERTMLGNEGGDQHTVRSSGRFRPRVGRAIEDVSVETCVIVRLRPDRCRTASARLPQLASRATPEQRARVERLVFEEPIDDFMAVWEQAQRSGVDADLDWSADGCSAGPFSELFEERLLPACVRHDFAYRNLGVLAFDPTDETRRRVDEQLAEDAEALGQDRLAEGLFETIQRFAAPGYFGTDLAELWELPGPLRPWLDQLGVSPDT